MFGYHYFNVILHPPYRNADTLEDLNHAVYLFNSGHMLKNRLAVIEERGREEYDRAVL